VASATGAAFPGRWGIGIAGEPAHSFPAVDPAINATAAHTFRRERFSAASSSYAGKLPQLATVIAGNADQGIGWLRSRIIMRLSEAQFHRRQVKRAIVA